MAAFDQPVTPIEEVLQVLIGEFCQGFFDWFEKQEEGFGVGVDFCENVVVFVFLEIPFELLEAAFKVPSSQECEVEGAVFHLLGHGRDVEWRCILVRCWCFVE